MDKHNGRLVMMGVIKTVAVDDDFVLLVFLGIVKGPNSGVKIIIDGPSESGDMNSEYSKNSCKTN